MLHRAAVNNKLLVLLKRIMQDGILADFKLVGGTALALQIGHRISIDLDLFNPNAFDENDLLDYLQKHYDFKINYQSNNTLKGEIDDIKVDFIAHQYIELNPEIVLENIRSVSLSDIAAMKVNAIVRSGERIKDYIDLAFISSYFSLNEIQEFYIKKYPNSNAIMMFKALSFHDDINFNEPVKVISKNYNWEAVKSRLFSMIQQPNQIFEPLVF
jgi:hypothetical protein